MPKQALKELEQKKGNLERVIPPLVNRIGVVAAAEKLEISPATVGKWLKDNHYVSRTSWMKDTTPEQKVQIQASVARHDAWALAHGEINLGKEDFDFEAES